MDEYESEIIRQPGGAFNQRERKLLRRVGEHWTEGRRFSEERRRRLARYGTWIGIAVPVALAIVKIVEAFVAK